MPDAQENRMQNVPLSNTPSLNLVIAPLATEITRLLALADPAAVEKHEKGGVLWAAMEFLPGLAANMATDMYIEGGLIPAEYHAAELLPAGWSTVLDLVAKTGLRAPGEGASAANYEAGARWALDRIVAACPARGACTGSEPVPLEIARKAYHLFMLLAQVKMPADDAKGGGVLAMSHFTVEGLARNMNLGLYNYFGMYPSVTNPAYLPPIDWAARLAKIRGEGQAKCPNADQEDAQYHYFEGVRWTCAKFRDTFRDLSEPAPDYI